MLTPVPSAVFRFDAERHEYICGLTGTVLPHITGLLERAGWIDDTWFTEESCERGTAVHAMTAEYDLGALDVASCVSLFRGYLLSHVKAMGVMRPAWSAVEQPVVHPTWRFGGRPDRLGVVYGLRAVVEGKSGAAEKSHGIQTALQAILVSGDGIELPAEAIARFCLYWKASGKFKLEEHTRRADFDEARRILTKYCGR